MKAILPKQPRLISVPASYLTKELIQLYNVVAYKDGVLIDIGGVHWLKSRRTSMGIMYCVVRIYPPGIYICGYGETRGSGYDRKSASFLNALELAEIKFDRPGGIRDALLAIAETLGYAKAIVV